MNRDIYAIESEGTVRTKISQMFGSTGPYVIEGHRLDTLESVKLLLDESTRTSHETGSGTSKAKTSSVVGRAIVGGVLLGGVGALAGAATAKKGSTTNATRTEIINTKLLVELKFSDGSVVNAVVKSQSDYHWLISQASLPQATDEELAQLKLEAEHNARADAEEEERWNAVDTYLTGSAPERTDKQENAFMLGGVILGFASGVIAGVAASSFIVFIVITVLVAAVGIGIALGIESSYKQKWKEHQDKRGLSRVSCGIPSFGHLDG